MEIASRCFRSFRLFISSLSVFPKMISSILDVYMRSKGACFVMKTMIHLSNQLMQRFLPDPFLFVILLTFAVFGMGLDFYR